MEKKRLSEAKMAEIEAKIAKEKKVLEREKQRLSELRRNGFDFDAPSINEDLKLWECARLRLSSEEREAMLKGVFEKGNISLETLSQLQDYLSSDEVIAILKNVAKGKIEWQVLYDLKFSSHNLCRALWFEGTFEENQEIALPILKLIEHGALDSNILINSTFVDCWRYIGKEIIEDIINGIISEKVLVKAIRQPRFELSKKAMETLIQAVLNDDFSEDILYDVLQSRRDYKYSSYKQKLAPLLVDGFCEGKLSRDLLILLDQKYNFFSEDEWEEMYNSHLDFLVKEFVKKFYSRIEVEF